MWNDMWHMIQSCQYSMSIQNFRCLLFFNLDTGGEKRVILKCIQAVLLSFPNALNTKLECILKSYIKQKIFELVT